MDCNARNEEEEEEEEEDLYANYVRDEKRMVRMKVKNFSKATTCPLWTS
jgi:hypothetical protein